VNIRVNIAVDSLRDSIRRQNASLLARFDPDACIRLFDQVAKEKRYDHVPAPVRAMWSAIRAEFGDDGFEAFQKLTLLRLIETFEARVGTRRYTDAIRERFAVSFRRIAASIADPGFVEYRTENDILLKDLGLGRQRLFPAGHRVLEPDGGFQRAIMFRKGIAQALGVLKMLWETGSNDGWYQVHTHLSELDDFTAEGQVRCFLRVADMLAINPEVRGMCAGSWYFDPRLSVVSPRLAYLRTLPQDNGAYMFYSSLSLTGGALAKSDTRRKAYERGEYIPKSYVMVWPRRRIIAWAAATRAKEAASQPGRAGRPE
jgi:hypothetical protein